MHNQLDEGKVPHVTCICPTANRQEYIGLAIESFLAQTYTNAELLIVDDGELPTEVPAHPRVRYIRLTDRKRNIGEKRNFCCEQACGEIIVHWDDDDWSHPSRIEEQVARLKASRKNVTGYFSLSYYDVVLKRANRFLGWSNESATGTSLCYYKSYWKSHPFEKIALEEDVRFISKAQSDDDLESVDGIDRIVVRRHGGNTWGKGPDVVANPLWEDIEVHELPADFVRAVMPKKQISIVITTFNRPALLRHTLKSIAQQNFDSLEVIVVDDGSDSETIQVCKEYGAYYCKLVRPASQYYRNPARPNNAGVRRATGDIIILQNAECAHTGTSVIKSLSEKVTDTNAVFARVMALKQDGSEDWLYCGKQNPRPYFFCGAIKRSWFDKLRGFDEDFEGYGYEDDDFSDRLKREGVTFEFSDVGVTHLWHPTAGIVDMTKTRALFEVKKTEGTVRNLNREWGALGKADRPVVVPSTNLKYGKDGLTIDWWDTHPR